MQGTVQFSERSVQTNLIQADFTNHERTSNSRVEVTEVDRVRLRRLNEEVSGRTEEIARMVSHYFGTRLHPVHKGTFTFGGDSATGPDIEMEPMVTGSGNGCYKDPPGVCCECSC